MITNQQMLPNRWLKYAEARWKLRLIQRTLNAGKSVIIATNAKATEYKAKHFDMFRATKSGLYVQSGKKWLCIDYCAIKTGSSYINP